MPLPMMRKLMAMLLSYHPLPMPSPAPPPSARLTVRAAALTYPVIVEPGIAHRLAGVLDESLSARRRFIVSSPTVWRLHGAILGSVTSEDPILIPDGERFKTLTTAGRIYDALIKAQADRGCALIAAGGGVVGDVAGFAAASFLRGVPVVQVPTTLLAQVDSAIGGKTGVNHALGKNIIGAFHQPSAVVIDPELLGTLPRREFRAGLYEVVKYGVIADPALFEQLESGLAPLFARDLAALVPVIAASCRIKARFVTEDEREAGPRRVLNFGHTAGHALEAVTRYRRFRHGEAVAYGMLVAAEVAAARGILSDAPRERLRALITAMGPLPPIADIEAAQVLDAIARDKKIISGTLHYVLPAAIGQTIDATDVTSVELLAALRAVGLRG
jgi:3-dehydroquinate synthase